MENDPLQQEINKILEKEHAKVTAEEAFTHASMLLVAGLRGRKGMLATLMKDAHDRGAQYLSAVLVCVVLSARDLARGFANNPQADFSEALTDCDQNADGMQEAHAYLGKFMACADNGAVYSIGTDLQTTLTSLPSLTGASMAMHMVHGSVQLVEVILSQADQSAMERIRGDHDR